MQRMHVFRSQARTAIDLESSLEDGHLLSQVPVLGGQDEPGQQECSDQKIDRSEDGNEKVSRS